MLAGAYAPSRAIDAREVKWERPDEVYPWSSKLGVWRRVRDSYETSISFFVEAGQDPQRALVPVKNKNKIPLTFYI
jgi:hypothetical protein